MSLAPTYGGGVRAFRMASGVFRVVRLWHWYFSYRRF